MKKLIIILIAFNASLCIAHKDTKAQADVPNTTKEGSRKTKAEKPEEASQEEENSKKDEPGSKESKPKTHKVEKEHFKILLKMDGVFESASTSEVSIQTKIWSTFSVLKALPQGSRVKKGDLLVKLDMEKIDERIESLRNEIRLMELDRNIAQAELKLAEAMAPMELAALERREKHSKEDLERYEKIHRPYNRRSAAMSLKNYKDSLAYVQEELNQLKKMYEADDLTEETEEIILQRAENSVAKAKFSLEGAEIRNEETTKIKFPREDLAVREKAKQDELSVKSLRKIQPVALEKKRLEASKLEEQRTKAKRDLSRLESDRKTMAVPSPASGILYRGSFDRGKWSGEATLKPRLKKGGALKPNEVFMTIVQPGPLVVRSDLAEADIRRVKKGLAGKAKSKAFPDISITATVDKVSEVPISPGKFDLVTKVNLPKEARGILPGMSCKLEFVAYENKDALVIPASAVFSETADEDSKFVYLYRKDKKPKKQVVKIGEKNGDKVEILEGLRAGKEILSEKPKK